MAKCGEVLELRCRGCGEPFSWTLKRCTTPIWCSGKCRKRTLYSGTCVDCGGRTDGIASGYRGGRGVQRCRECNARLMGERSKRAAQLRREEVEALWAQGLLQREIADALGCTRDALNGYVVRLRKEGAALPYRYNTSRAGRAAQRRNGRKAAARLHAAA